LCILKVAATALPAGKLNHLTAIWQVAYRLWWVVMLEFDRLIKLKLLGCEETTKRKNEIVICSNQRTRSPRFLPHVPAALLRRTVEAIARLAGRKYLPIAQGSFRKIVTA
jgi:hypothetical protein